METNIKVAILCVMFGVQQFKQEHDEWNELSWSNVIGKEFSMSALLEEHT